MDAKQNTDGSNATSTNNRRIRVFISSTFRDMIAERDDLMTHTWPALRRFCQERHVELVEVDLRWGIAESQSTRKETLKLCLDEIRACRPFFIGLLGERYGWVPGDDAFTADLKEEQSWLKDLHGKSVTELEILHGVLNDPKMAGRAFFYFRDPKYVEFVPAEKKSDFTAENAESAEKQKQLKNLIKHTCTTKKIPLRENYPDPKQLAAMVLTDLKAAIEAQFPKEDVPDALTREAQDHEAFAEIRRRTYIRRADYFEVLNRHAAGEGGPMVLLGDSGSGKSALLANWVECWRKAYPKDFIFQHYIGGTPDSADHWRLMTRLIAEIKRWADDPEEVPKSHDDILKTFPVWLAKARIRAERQGMRFILVLDALNQLNDQDHARLLGWLPEYPFTGPLRLIVSTLPGDTLKALEQCGWTSLQVKPLTSDERRQMIADYLARFGKKLNTVRIERLAAVPAAANPLYLKILLDELRVTGTHDRLDERLDEYLSAPDIPALLRKVLDRYQHDYECDRPGLVGEALGLIWAARRGLTETELLRLLRPKSESAGLPQLPPAIWNPFRAVLEEGLVDRGGILNFAHDFLRTAVATAFVPDQKQRNAYRLQLADDFEKQPVTARSCDEMPWLLWQTNQCDRLRACVLNIDRFLEIDQEELMRYWVWLGEERTIGKAYLVSFEHWSAESDHPAALILLIPLALGTLLNIVALHTDAESLLRHALVVLENQLGENHDVVAEALGAIAGLLQDTNRSAEAEPLYRRALAIAELNHGQNHPDITLHLNNLAVLLQATNRMAEAEPLMRRALAIDEQSFGPHHPKIVTALNNLAQLLKATNRLAEAEPLLRQALAIDEQSFGKDHRNVAGNLNNLADFLQDTNRMAEAEPLYRRAIEVFEKSFGKNHPNVATNLTNLATLLYNTKRLGEAELLMRRALTIDEHCFGPDHPKVATNLNNLAALLQSTGRLVEAETMFRRALAVDEQSYGADHPDVARDLNNLAQLLQNTDRLAESEPLMHRHLVIFFKFRHVTGHPHQHQHSAVNNYARLLARMGHTRDEIGIRLNDLARPFGIEFE